MSTIIPFIMAMSSVGRTGRGRVLESFLIVSVKPRQKRFGKSIRFWITAKSGIFSGESLQRPQAEACPLNSELLEFHSEEAYDQTNQTPRLYADERSCGTHAGGHEGVSAPVSKHHGPE